MMTPTAKAYLDGFGAVRTVLNYDSLTVDEILGSLDSEQDADPRLTPWRRGYNAAIRTAFGN
jgi:hypothetical protein